MIFRPLVENLIRESGDSLTVRSLTRELEHDLIEAFQISRPLVDKFPDVFFQSRSFLDFLIRISKLPSFREYHRPQERPPGRHSDSWLLDEERQKNRQLERDKDSLHDQLERCQKELDTFQQRQARLTSERDSLRAQLDTCRRYLETLNSGSPDTLHDEARKLRSDLESCRLQVQTLLTQLDACNTQKSDLGRTVSELLSERAQSEATTRALQAQVQECQKINDGLRARYQTLLQFLKDYDAHAKQLMLVNNTVHEQKMYLEKVNDKLETQFEILSKEHTVLKERYRHLLGEETGDSDSSDAEDPSKPIKTETMDTESVSEIKQEKVSPSQSYSSSLQTYAYELENCKRQSERDSQEIQKLQDTLNSCQAELKIVQSQLESQQHENASLKTKIDTLRSLHDSFQEELDRCIEDKQSLQRQLDCSEKQWQQSVSSIQTNHQYRLEELNQQYQTLLQFLREYDDHAKQLMITNTTLYGDNLQMAQANESLQEAILQQNQQHSDLRQRYETLIHQTPVEGDIKPMDTDLFPLEPTLFPTDIKREEGDSLDPDRLASPGLENRKCISAQHFDAQSETSTNVLSIDESDTWDMDLAIQNALKETYSADDGDDWQTKARDQLPQDLQLLKRLKLLAPEKEMEERLECIGKLHALYSDIPFPKWCKDFLKNVQKLRKVRLHQKGVDIKDLVDLVAEGKKLAKHFQFSLTTDTLSEDILHSQKMADCESLKKDLATYFGISVPTFPSLQEHIGKLLKMDTTLLTFNEHIENYRKQIQEACRQQMEQDCSERIRKAKEEGEKQIKEEQDQWNEVKADLEKQIEDWRQFYEPLLKKLNLDANLPKETFAIRMTENVQSLLAWKEDFENWKSILEMKASSTKNEFTERLRTCGNVAKRQCTSLENTSFIEVENLFIAFYKKYFMLKWNFYDEKLPKDTEIITQLKEKLNILRNLPTQMRSGHLLKILTEYVEYDLAISMNDINVIKEIVNINDLLDTAVKHTEVHLDRLLLPEGDTLKRKGKLSKPKH